MVRVASNPGEVKNLAPFETAIKMQRTADADGSIHYKDQTVHKKYSGIVLGTTTGIIGPGANEKLDSVFNKKAPSPVSADEAYGNSTPATVVIGEEPKPQKEPGKLAANDSNGASLNSIPESIRYWKNYFTK